MLEPFAVKVPHRPEELPRVLLVAVRVLAEVVLVRARLVIPLVLANRRDLRPTSGPGHEGRARDGPVLGVCHQRLHREDVQHPHGGAGRCEEQRRQLVHSKICLRTQEHVKLVCRAAELRGEGLCGGHGDAREAQHALHRRVRADELVHELRRELAAHEGQLQSRERAVLFRQNVVVGGGLQQLHPLIVVQEAVKHLLHVLLLGVPGLHEEVERGLPVPVLAQGVGPGLQQLL
mmetsp:Transcript_102805/g.299848  ORF Transcript_102805/g.299848 Transcript_102805/m.299848 type:complete len:233 (-) Transcript_102805:578-1276(-)